MDRSRWGQTTLLCPNYEIAIDVMSAVLTVLTVEAILRALRTICFQHGVAKKKGLHWRQHLPLLSCCAAILSMTSQLGIVLLKFADSTLLVAIDLLPSLLHALRSVFAFAEIECDYVHFFSMTVKAQEASVGRQRVQDAIHQRFQAMPKQANPIARLRVRCDMPYSNCLAISNVSTCDDILLMLVLSDLHGFRCVRDPTGRSRAHVAQRRHLY
eukprot:2997715-Pleurochrysis_carterae.AAC.1